VYAPVVAAADFDAAIAYLARRLDENSAPDNFLRSLLTIEPGSPAWEEQRARFVRALNDRHAVSSSPRRSQDRTATPPPTDPSVPFANAPDTDFSRPVNRAWVAGHLGHGCASPPPGDAAAIVARARRAFEWWRDTEVAERRRLLVAVADTMERRRGDSIGVMAAETAKVAREADTEVSEAVDTARWCAHLITDDGAEVLTLAPERVVSGA
jgi:RHH-type proline utilization regulon transcriptional repressor/proline dehydrogenase/delta 1-pyrroline-5-carboxylate dehydrogenase